MHDPPDLAEEVKPPKRACRNRPKQWPQPTQNPPPEPPRSASKADAPRTAYPAVDAVAVAVTEGEIATPLPPQSPQQSRAK